MARTPRASVSKTSGQGVSRLTYQQAYRQRHSAQDSGPSVSVKSSSETPSSGDRRNYAKSKSGTGAEFNVSYGETYQPGDLKDIKELGSLKPSKSSVSLNRSAGKKLK